MDWLNLGHGVARRQGVPDSFMKHIRLRTMTTATVTGRARAGILPRASSVSPAMCADTNIPMAVARQERGARESDMADRAGKLLVTIDGLRHLSLATTRR